VLYLTFFWKFTSHPQHDKPLFCEGLIVYFSRWAEYNPKTWGNAYGWHMFESAMAFGKDHGYILSHDEIINHLINVRRN
jgi:hypothetical protein